MVLLLAGLCLIFAIVFFVMFPGIFATAYGFAIAAASFFAIFMFASDRVCELISLVASAGFWP